MLEEWSLKHQALSRVISAVLAVMCLVTLISGVAGFVSAGKDFSQDRSDYKTLRDRIAEAESLDAQLNGGKAEYDKTAAELKAEKGQYDDDASRHREELTEYTATNAGLQMGSGSIGSGPFGGPDLTDAADRYPLFSAAASKHACGGAAESVRCPPDSRSFGRLEARSGRNADLGACSAVHTGTPARQECCSCGKCSADRDKAA